MSWNFYRHIDNWHAHPWISKILCKIGRHDYEFVWMDGDYGILSCFYCEKRRSSRTSFGNCEHCDEELGKEWRCYNEQCKAERWEEAWDTIEGSE
ncbi:hypothetical protein LCGC14_1167480 [marine sediment metagenome]|uniref:Uncharacterized protein n=1 Tax=marine sediment metagenome TaxID=412755 RepID=A0A0F9PWB5_9ZZZZ